MTAKKIFHNLKKFGVFYLWVLFAVFMIISWINDPYDPLLTGTRRYGHNHEYALLQGLAITFAELLVFTFMVRPSSYNKSYGRIIAAMIIFIPWGFLSIILSMHAGDITILHFFWVFSLVLILLFTLIAAIIRFLIHKTGIGGE